MSHGGRIDIKATQWTPRRFAAGLIACIFAILAAGCRDHIATTRVPYNGPTEPLATIVQKINDNNARLPTLWAHQHFKGTIFDEHRNPHAVSANGVLLYRGPHSMRIVAEDDVIGPVFEIGCTAELYWMKVVPQLDTLWWGRMSNVARPCSRSIPVRPDLVLDVLAVGTIGTNFGQPPYPVMRFNNDADAYMVDSVIPSGDRMLAQKEVWYDRATLHPALVLLYDANGRVVLRAHLSRFEPVEVSDTPQNQWPTVATQYDLLFPDTGSKMSFTLSDQALTHNKIPLAGSIHLPDLRNAGVKNVTQIDEDCDR